MGGEGGLGGFAAGGASGPGTLGDTWAGAAQGPTTRTSRSEPYNPNRPLRSQHNVGQAADGRSALNAGEAVDLALAVGAAGSGRLRAREDLERFEIGRAHV